MKKIFKYASIFTFGLLVLASCENKDNIPDVIYKMEFATAPVASENSIDYLWYPVTSAKSYTLQISESPNFETLVLEKEIEATSFTATDMMFDTPYYTRIRANFASSTGEWVKADDGKAVVCSNVKLPILYLSEVNKLNGADVTFKWRECDNLGSIEVIDSLRGAQIALHTLTAQELADRSVTLKELPRGMVLRGFLRYSADHPDAAMRNLPLNQLSAKTYFPTAISVIAFGGITPQVTLLDDYVDLVTDVEVWQGKTSPTGEFTPEMVPGMQHTITAADRAAKMYRFAGSLPTDQQFYVRSYNNNDPNPRMRDFLPIFERTFVPGPIKIEAAGDFMKGLLSSYDGAMIDIKAGLTCTATDFNISGDLTVKGRSSKLAELPTLKFQKQMKITGEITKPIVFENIKFIRDADVDGANMNSEIFAFANDTKVRKILFKNCVFDNMDWGILRLPNNAGTIIDSIVFENCMITFTNPDDATKLTKAMGTRGSLGNIGLINMTNSANSSQVKYGIFKNCTISKLRVSLWKANSNGVSYTKTLEVTNCTFYNLNFVPDDLARNGGTGSVAFVVLKNNLVSFNNWDPYFRPWITFTRGSNTNTFVTNDVNLANEVAGTGAGNLPANPVYDPKGMMTSADIAATNKTTSSYAFTSDDITSNRIAASGKELFTDPDNNQFYFKSEFESYGKMGIGDPRWWEPGTVPMP